MRGRDGDDDGDLADLQQADAGASPRPRALPGDLRGRGDETLQDRLGVGVRRVLQRRDLPSTDGSWSRTWPTKSETAPAAGMRRPRRGGRRPRSAPSAIATRLMRGHRPRSGRAGGRSSGRSDVEPPCDGRGAAREVHHDLAAGGQPGEPAGEHRGRDLLLTGPPDRLGEPGELGGQQLPGALRRLVARGEPGAAARHDEARRARERRRSARPAPGRHRRRRRRARRPSTPLRRGGRRPAAPTGPAPHRESSDRRRRRRPHAPRARPRAGSSGRGGRGAPGHGTRESPGFTGEAPRIMAW